MPRRRMLRDMLMNYRMMGDGRGRGRERMMGREDYNYGPSSYRYDDAKYTGYRESEPEYMRNKSYDRGSRYPFMVSGEFGRYDGHYPYYDYSMMDYRGGRADYGDYGEGLTRDELEHWCKKMMSKLDEREKQMLSKETILQRAKTMGIEFKGFNEMEYYVNVVKNYTDHKKSIGENLDMAMKLARDDFFDEDGVYKGSEWLAIYYDIFVDED